ncbi:N-acetylglucosamine-6-phosphate deacetylase [Parasteatoda tepidariorum]|uniref:N-acetylglucosamine-6-phosphate deacetylase n=1 Tax=Parasteatoda tepidariorum TaxID=114398 RepID=UPI001C71F79D|nr:N-acetylglucosamine-6-phosphate deacetylase [Parasteatoda tepidariorum]XP_042900780.1 N-acetylglucosamine-6-phosphate deacetylase [Parasteatoda tepidariorum]XP_042900781.1 N-acetylglucosamine-6-phosphate deacetylase [Parasteatoda tepidariorum]
MDFVGKLFQFHNCRILRNSSIIKEDLWIRDGMIINPEPVFYDEKIVADIKVDCKDSLIVPGFIDLQINGGFGYDFSNPEKDVSSSIDAVSKNLLQHGVTSFCPTVITSSPDQYHKIIPKIKTQKGGRHGAGILGVHVEGPFINIDKKGAHPVQHIRHLDNGIEDVIKTYGTLDNIRIITLAPELDPDNIVIKELVQRGVTVSLGHSACHLSESEKAANNGASFITHLFNAMLPFHHRDPGLVGLLASHKILPPKKVFYGLIADGIHTHPAALRIAFRTDPKGLVLVTDAISAMGLKPGTYNLGDQAVTVTEDRAVVAGTDTLSGSIATMDFCIKFLLSATGCTLVEALECATLHPSQVLGITSKKGTLDFDTEADFVLLDEQLNVQTTYIAGEKVWGKDFLTK